MIRIAVYGKGGIGKSTTVSNVAAALAEMGLRVMQIGCDPKADSTILLRHGEAVPAVLDLYNKKKQSLQLEDMIRIGYNNVICVEAGGPTPGLGCAGRGIITALEKLKELGAYEVYKPDVVLYDVLGDVVCGGFSMPMRNGYADKVFILTSGENMAIHAAANIAMAVQNFKNRGYAGLGGLILNRRDVPREEKKVVELADDFQTAVIGTLSHSSQVALAEEQQKTLMECYPESEMAEEYRALAVQMYRICGGVLKDENDVVRDEYMRKCMDEHMDKYIDEHMDKYTDERMNEHINECMNGQTQEDV
ncbi:AAA family ATPase [Blautia sp. MSJ-9]|nr:AAA family ATPase [Blautia sp. MSJ-9]